MTDISARHLITGEIIDSILDRRICLYREGDNDAVKDTYGIIHTALGRFKAMLEAEYSASDRMLDRIYDFCDRLYKIGQHIRVDAKLRMLDLDSISNLELVGWLTATLPGKDKLHCRQKLYEFAVKRMGEEELRGLE